MGRGGQIIRRRESLVHYKSFNIFWVFPLYNVFLILWWKRVGWQRPLPRFSSYSTPFQVHNIKNTVLYRLCLSSNKSNLKKATLNCLSSERQNCLQPQPPLSYQIYSYLLPSFPPSSSFFAESHNFANIACMGTSQFKRQQKNVASFTVFSLVSCPVYSRRMTILAY
jgi:hypothetical protein